MATSLLTDPTGMRRQWLVDAGAHLRSVVYLPWPAYRDVLEGLVRDLNLSTELVNTAVRLHQEYHRQLQRDRLEYVRGEVRRRHRLVVPMVVAPRPQFKKARR